MKYLAHMSKNGDEQLLKEHLENSAILCGRFADQFGAYEWGYCCGYLHDLGKYSEKFQKRIHGSEEKVDHSTAVQNCVGIKRECISFSVTVLRGIIQEFRIQEALETQACEAR